MANRDDRRHQSGAGPAGRRVRRAFRKLGGKRLFGSEANFVRTLPEGVPLQALSELQTIFSTDELNALIAPQQPLFERTTGGRPLNRVESERAVRVAFLTSLAEEIFADDDRAHFWLRTPAPVLGGRRPIDLSESEEGAELVEQMLYRIAYGISA